MTLRVMIFVVARGPARKIEKSGFQTQANPRQIEVWDFVERTPNFARFFTILTLTGDKIHDFDPHDHDFVNARTRSRSLVRKIFSHAQEIFHHAMHDDNVQRLVERCTDV